MNIEQVMEFIVKNKAANSELRWYAEIFDRLIWLLNDNGTELLKVRTKWLESEEYEKVVIALEMGETFPYNNRQEMESRFSTIKEKWPELSERCNQLLEDWDKQFNKNL